MPITEHHTHQKGIILQTSAAIENAYNSENKLHITKNCQKETSIQIYKFKKYSFTPYNTAEELSKYS